MKRPKAILKNILSAIIRRVSAWRRPSKATNRRRLFRRGETLEPIRFRELTADDVPALAAIHVRTWIETYSPVTKNGPSLQVREYQWREKFRHKNAGWFVIGVENSKGEMIGFAAGNTHNNEEYKGEINKIYLLREYHRLGIGKKLLREVVKKFQTMGIQSMILFGIPQNPSCYFHEAMGGKRLYDDKGGFNGGYGWKDFSKILEGE